MYSREYSTAGNRKEDVSASVAMVHSIPELIVSEEVCYTLFEPRREKTGFRGFRPGLTQTDLYCHRSRLEA